jgi:hypothetical protein
MKRFALLLSLAAFSTAPASAATYHTETVDIAALGSRLAALGSAHVVSILPSVSHAKHWCPPPPVDGGYGCYPTTPGGPPVCVDPGPAAQACIDFQLLDSVLLVTSSE